MLVQPDRDAGLPISAGALHPSFYPALALAPVPALAPAPAPAPVSASAPVRPVRPAPRAPAPDPKPPRTRHRGRRPGPVRRTLPLLGPAFVAAIAYIDPGNFATNVSGGAALGYTLVWVVVLANVVAMLVQYLSAKLGVATGRNLAQLCRERLPGPGRWLMWGQAELVVMATDLAEFVGAAIALQLLFGLGPLSAGAVTAVVTFAILAVRQFGRRPFEALIVALLIIVTVVFGYEILVVGPDPGAVAGGLLPRLPGSESLLLASGIVGATVMPHAVYLHSAMTAGLSPDPTDVISRRRLLRVQRIDVLTALGLAGAVNVAMLVFAAAVFHGRAVSVASLAEVHAGLAAVVGAGAALAFAVALLASGLSSAGVGTCAGEVVMQGYLRQRIAPGLRRLITMVPALVLLGSGLNTGMALLLSQVVLSFGIPLTLVPLVVLTARPEVMGELVNRRVTTVAGVTVAAAIIALNVFLIVQVLGSAGLSGAGS